MSDAALNLNNEFNKLLDGIGIDPRALNGKVTFLGQDPILPTVAHAGAISALTRALPAYLSALIWQKKTGRGQDITVDLRKTLFDMSPFFPGSLGVEMNGRKVESDPLTQNISMTMYKTKDSRWFLPTAIYPKAIEKLTKLLGCSFDHDSVQAAISKWNADDLQAAFDKLDLPGTIVKTQEEYDNDPQTPYIKRAPLVKITKIADGNPVPLPNFDRPLAGIKAMGLTHVLAGPTVLRTLAEQGADCFNLWGKESTEEELTYYLANAGVRSGFTDLKNDVDRKKTFNLLKEADVFVENVHGKLLKELAITPEDLVKNSSRGIVNVSIRCYGHDGPKADLPGFDMHAVSNSGYCYVEGTAEEPKLPYTEVFNDFTAGFLAAAGAQAALLRRATEGGSYKVEVSLSRCTEYYNSLGFFDKDYVNKMVNSDAQHTLGIPDPLILQTPLGMYKRLKAEINLSETQPYWSETALIPRGSSRFTL
ncbi:CoA transferase [Fructilactobacillus ixorae]|uniref:CoA transferase n=1 Tax=Fructilactobacillus ixorae TaxID=1750535 RepID=A0ABY5C4G9_9LACO|nr:CoA transferase [Fructilactobacillus ixorae]USS93477.1 CoA transferase [Fructilactobacillus ixorae]